MKFNGIFSSSLGNVLEWYDFGLFAFYAPLLEKLFFPNKHGTAGLLATFGIFALGFICRPLGAILYGILGDTKGRSPALRLSILMVCIPTLLIGLLPTYALVGILAPILLTSCRLLQGLSLGGEASGNVIYLAESASPHRRGFFTSFSSSGANLGILIASAVIYANGLLFTEDSLLNGAWRIPFFLSGVISLMVYYLRLQVAETPVFTQLRATHQFTDHPLKVMLAEQKLQVMSTIGLICMGSTLYYVSVIYMPTYLVNYAHFSSAEARQLISLCVASMLILVPAAGWLSDRLGRRKLLLANAVLIGLLIIPIVYCLTFAGISFIYLALITLTVLSSSDQAATSIGVVEHYPVKARYTGLSLGYNLGYSVYGGIAPFVAAWLVAYFHTPIILGFYLLICAFITGTTVYFTVKNPKK